MKKLILPLSLVLLGFAALTNNASAQRYDTRIDVPRLVAQPSIRVARDNRVADELDDLNRAVRRVRLQIREFGGGRRLRYEFERVARASDQLNYAFRRGTLSRREIRSRIQRVRYELDRVRQELRARR